MQENNPNQEPPVTPETPEPAAVNTPGGLSSDERMWGMFAHLAALLGGVLTSWGLGLGVFIGPLIVWLIKKDTMPFVDDQGKESLNFNITVALAALVLLLFTLITFGIGLIIAIPLGLALAVFWLVFTIIASIKANEGVRYRYPVALRLIK